MIHFIYIMEIVDVKSYFISVFVPDIPGVLGLYSANNIKFGNFTCLPKSVDKKFIAEKSSWNSFSGTIAKIEKSFGSIKSIRAKTIIIISFFKT